MAGALCVGIMKTQALVALALGAFAIACSSSAHEDSDAAGSAEAVWVTRDPSECGVKWHEVCSGTPSAALHANLRKALLPAITKPGQSAADVPDLAPDFEQYWTEGEYGLYEAELAGLDVRSTAMEGQSNNIIALLHKDEVVAWALTPSAQDAQVLSFGCAFVELDATDLLYRHGGLAGAKAECGDLKARKEVDLRCHARFLSNDCGRTDTACLNKAHRDVLDCCVENGRGTYACDHVGYAQP